MTHEDQRGQRCRNSWRPSDGSLSWQAQRRPPLVPPEPDTWSPPTTRAPQPGSWMPSPQRSYDRRLMGMQVEDWSSAATTLATIHATQEPLPVTFNNPNLIPVVPRHLQASRMSSQAEGFQQEEELENRRLPQIWHPSIDDLVRRTAHDYDLVMNYERDAEGGQRWLPEDITIIQDVGKNLHRDIFAVRRWQRVVADQGDQDKTMMMQIKRDANFLKLLCERVQRAINRYEQKCEFELLRDGVYARDEDGNFYKPVVPQQYSAEGSYLQTVAHPSIENVEDVVLSHPSDGRQSVIYSGMYHSRLSSISKRYQTPPEDHNAPSLSPNRNLALDSTSQQTPFDKSKAEATRRTTLRHPGRVLDGRVSKAYPEPYSGNKRRTLSPAYRGRSPESDTYSAHSTSDKIPRRRGRNNRFEREGVSRRQAKRDRVHNRHSSQMAGRLGKHVLHY